ncbi:hypothetical protein [Phaeodactylibacter luteus]|uniref:hypothetical protein n=1 Tax=Phaeodactylibacter luteus TaxID=1564516 RepID=UPI0014780745|nr:hypothetical protein [Phaeodactylibacter luteus]
MKKISRNTATAIAFLSAIALSSCNRGYGCPSNFSADEALSSVVTTVAHVFNLIF